MVIMFTSRKPLAIAFIFSLIFSAVGLAVKGVPDEERFKHCKPLASKRKSSAYSQNGSYIEAKGTFLNICLDTEQGRWVVIKAAYGGDKRFLLNESLIYELTDNLPGIVKHYETIEEYDWRYEILEYCKQGDLEQLLKEKKSFSEDFIRELFGQILTALASLHEQRIAHMDIKLANIFLDESGRTKIGDFGFSEKFAAGKLRRGLVGTYSSMAPEVASSNPYDPFKADIFSAGAILATMAMGNPLYNIIDASDYHYKFFLTWDTGILIRTYAEQKGIDLSKEFLDLASRMMDKNPETRITLKDALAHPWFSHKVLMHLPKASLETKTENDK